MEAFKKWLPTEYGTFKIQNHEGLKDARRRGWRACAKHFYSNGEHPDEIAENIKEELGKE